MKAREKPTVEQMAWMEQNNYTEKEMDAFWKDGSSFEFSIQFAVKRGLSWRDMNMSFVTMLPQLRKLDYALFEEIMAETQSEELLVEKIDTGEELKNFDFRRVLDFEIQREIKYNANGHKFTFSILKMCERTFALEWAAGKEERFDTFFQPPYEVEKHILREKN